MKNPWLVFVLALGVFCGVPAKPAHAVKLWDSWKAVRPEGPGYVFFATAKTGHRPDMAQDVYLSQVPGTTDTSAVLPEDIDLAITYISAGGSGEETKDKDRTRLRLKMLTPRSIDWETVAEQIEDVEKKRRKGERWSGVLKFRIDAEDIPYGLTVFKVDSTLDRKPPFIMINRVRKSLDRIMAEAAGAQAGTLPPGQMVPGGDVPNDPPAAPPNGGYFDPTAHQRMLDAQKGLNNPPPTTTQVAIAIAIEEADGDLVSEKLTAKVSYSGGAEEAVDVNAGYCRRTIPGPLEAISVTVTNVRYRFHGRRISDTGVLIFTFREEDGDRRPVRDREFRHGGRESKTVTYTVAVEGFRAARRDGIPTKFRTRINGRLAERDLEFDANGEATFTAPRGVEVRILGSDSTRPYWQQPVCDEDNTFTIRRTNQPGKEMMVSR